VLTFYYAANTCALASHIALEEVGAAYETRSVDFRSGEQTKPDYLKINPKGRVPALATERGVLTETPAILGYVAQTHPEARLAPVDDPFAFAELQSFMSYLCSTVHVAHAHPPRAYRLADGPAAQDAMKKKVPEALGACFDLIERKMFKGPWAMGDALRSPTPISLPSAVDGGRQRRSGRVPPRARPSQPDGEASSRSAGAQERGAGLVV
jgi:glutathione S-transferase